MTTEQFLGLLDHMKEIAAAVNAFTSEDVQKEAFRALVGAYGLVPVAKPSAPEEDAAEERAPKAANATKKAAKGPRKRAASLAPDKELNLRPPGKQPFKEFATEKSPASNPERDVVAAYYLTVVVETTATASAVLSCYRDAGWREPADLRNSLQKTASVQGWLNTADMENIGVTPGGRNQVEHDLPRPQRTK